jgi:beta-glucosidase-like glycosyl hydrolase
MYLCHVCSSKQLRTEMARQDPYLGEQLAGPAVVGIQSAGVIATAKHYIDNSQEIGRAGVVETVDERSQWEMYLPAFEGAVRDCAPLALPNIIMLGSFPIFYTQPGLTYLR